MSEVNKLKGRNHSMVAQLAHATGRHPAHINYSANQYVGVDSIGDATLAQLQQRTEFLRDWLESTTRTHPPLIPIPVEDGPTPPGAWRSTSSGICRACGNPYNVRALIRKDDVGRTVHATCPPQSPHH